MSAALDKFFDHYYRRRPVTATFTGMHAYDALLPDWSPGGLDALASEMRALIAMLANAHPPGASSGMLRGDVDALDAELARRFLEIQLAESMGRHGVRGNPSLWTGEAIFSVISLMIRRFAPLEDRLESTVARLERIPQFLIEARATLTFATPAAWTAKALKECEGAAVLLDRGLERWLESGPAQHGTLARVRGAAGVARLAFARFAEWLAGREAAAETAASCGPALYDALLERAHWCDQSRADLLALAHREMRDAQHRLDELASSVAGSLSAAQEQMAAKHPSPDEYLASFARVWNACRARVEERDVVTWGDWPIRYVPYPAWTADAAPYLYYLFYRSPAPLDPLDVYDYVVPALPADRAEQHLRAWNDSVIKLNHVVHHGAIGHHVQNWHAARRAPSRVGQIAAVDCATRLAMLSAATMAEGWACYATRLMEELEFLDPLERVSEAHSRVRFLARAIVDMELHQGTFSFDDAIRYWVEHVGGSTDAARGEVVKASMFPCTAIIYWLGTEAIVRLRQRLERERGNSFSLKAFHDELLGHGSLPVALVAQLMTTTGEPLGRPHINLESHAMSAAQRLGRLMLLALALPSSCAKGARRNAPTNDLLIVGYDREPDTMNRYSTHILEDIQSCVIEGLVTSDEHMNIVPVLAAEIPTLENGEVKLRPDGGMDVTWKLRPGVKWHDGVAHTSADVKFTVDAINKGDWKPESTDGFDRISSVDTPDSLTAVVHYKEVYAPYKLQFFRGTLPKHLLEGRDIDKANDYNRNALGTGPYRVAEWKTGEYILLEAAPNYWRGPQYPKIKKILFRFIANTSTRINQLRAGELHVVALVPWDKVRELEGVPGIRLNRVLGNGYEHVTLNESKFAPFTDLRVRRALAHAIDRETILKTILEGQVAIANGPIQPLSWAYEPKTASYAYDPAASKALLDSAGWRVGPTGIRVKGGTPLSFTLITQAGYAIRENVSQAIQKQFKDVGVDMKVKLLDGTSISGVWFSGEFEALLNWWQLGADPELTLLFAADRVPPAGRNINYYRDAELTKVLYASDRTVDQEKRRALLSEAQKRIADMAVEIPLYNTTKIDAVPVTLENFKGNPTNAGPFWNVHEWEVGSAKKP